MLAILITVIFNDSDSQTASSSKGKVIPLSSNTQLSSNQIRTSSTIAKIEQVQRGLINNKAISLPPIPMDARVAPLKVESNNSLGDTAKTLAAQVLSNTKVSLPVAVTPRETTPSIKTTIGQSSSVS